MASSVFHAIKTKFLMHIETVSSFGSNQENFFNSFDFANLLPVFCQSWFEMCRKEVAFCKAGFFSRKNSFFSDSPKFVHNSTHFSRNPQPLFESTSRNAVSTLILHMARYGAKLFWLLKKLSTTCCGRNIMMGSQSTVNHGLVTRLWCLSNSKFVQHAQDSEFRIFQLGQTHRSG